MPILLLWRKHKKSHQVSLMAFGLIKFKSLATACDATIWIVQRASHVGLVLLLDSIQVWSRSFLLLFNCKLDGVGSCFCSQIIHSCLQAFFPCIEVHRSELAEIWFLNMDVQALALADISSPIGCHIQYCLLRDLPNSLVQVLDVLRDFRDILNRAIGHDQFVLHIVIP